VSTDLAAIPVAILAGGLGTRLRPSIGDRAKVVAEVAGRPFLTHLLDQAAAAGFREVVLCTGHRADEVEAALGARHGPLRLRYSPETEPLGTGGALRHALPLLDAPAFLAMNGDSFCEIDLAALWAWHVAKRAEATLVAVQVPDASRYGRVEIADDRVREFTEKQADGKPGWINAGIYCLSRARIEGLDPGRPLSLERDALPGWASAALLYGHCVRGRFIDIGTPGTYSAASQFFGGQSRGPE
jgi:NDP-sugar pyrophosphorylase family protein